MHKHADLSHSANQNRVQRKSEECRMDENKRMKPKKGHIGEGEGEECSSELTSCGVGMVLSMAGRRQQKQTVCFLPRKQNLN